MFYLCRVNFTAEPKYFDLPGAGKVFIRKNTNARRIKISIHPSGKVYLTVPRGISESAAIGFANDKKDWIVKHLEKIASKQVKRPAFDGTVPLKTRFFEIFVERIRGRGYEYRIGNGKTIVQIPPDADLSSEMAQKVIRKALTETWRLEAVTFLPERLFKLARQHGFTFSGPTIRNSVSRWGSCSSSGSINLSLHLMRLPDHLIDYVLLHELVHTVHHNHGPGFWQRLNELTGDAKALRKEMRNYSLREF